MSRDAKGASHGGEDPAARVPWEQPADRAGLRVEQRNYDDQMLVPSAQGSEMGPLKCIDRQH